MRVSCEEREKGGAIPERIAESPPVAIGWI
jgi:hypothetical protein